MSDPAAETHPIDGTDSAKRRLAERVRRVVAEVLLGAVELRPDEPLSALGRDSLKTARLWLELHRRFKVAMPLEWLGAGPTLAELVDRVAAVPAAEPGEAEPLEPENPAAPAPRDPLAPFALTPLQQAYCLGRRADLSPDPVGCHLYRELAIDDLDPERLRRAWQRLVEHHEMLRMVVTAAGEQRILATAPPWNLVVHEPGGAPEEGIAEVRRRLSHARYEPGDWPLFRLEVSCREVGPSVVHWSLEALVTDGQGLDLLLRQWAEWYHDPDATLPAALSARDCVVSLLAGRSAGDDLDFWLDRLAELPPGPCLPRAPAAIPAAGARRRPFSGRLDRERWRLLRRRAEALEITPTALLLTLFADVLARHGGGPRFSVVLTTSRRPWLPAEAEGTVGPFTSSWVHVVPDLLGQTVEEAATGVHRRLCQELEHAALGGVEVFRELRARGSILPQLPVVFTSLLGGEVADDGRSFADHVTYAVSQTSGVFLDHQVWEQGGELRFRWDVAEGVWALGSPETLFAAFETSLQASAAEAETPPPALRPLNELQQAYYVARAGGTQAEGCQVYHSFEVRDLDPARLEEAWRRMVETYEVLRSVVGRDGQLRIRSAAPAGLRLPVIELAGSDDAEATLRALREEMTHRPFPLDRWPPFDLRITRSRGGETTVHAALDLAVADGMSIHFLFREGLRLHAQPEATPAARAPRPPRPCPAVAESWRTRFQNLPAGPRLPPLGPSAGGVRRRFSTRLEGWAAAKAWARERGFGPDALLLVPLLETLASRLGPDAFTVPVVVWPASEELLPPGERTVLAWVTRAAGERSVLERADAYQRQIAADVAASGSGLAELRRHVLRQRREGSFELPVVYTGLLDFAAVLLPPGASAGPWLTSTPDVALDIIPIDHGDTLELACDLAPVDLPEDRTVALFAALRESVEQRVIARAEPLRHRFERQARERPDAIALRARDGQMSFGELNRRANRVAWRLKGQGVGPETVVGIALPRGAAMVAAVFGVLKAGGAYLPLEPSLPAERLTLILSEARAALLLTGPDEAEGEDQGNPPLVASPLHTAYVIFTSGSTGKPKGVTVRHRSVLGLLAWCQRTFAFGPEDLGLSVASLGFDLSVFDLFGLLGFGAGLYLADEEEQKDPVLLLDALLREPVTFWNSAPAVLESLLPILPMAAPHAALRLVFLSGDYMPLSLPDVVRGVFRRARIVSLGGATEATVWSNFFPVGEIDPEWRSIPYGKPIDDARYLVLDERFEPCPVGVEGDLYIGGECLAVGYHHQPARTAERFLPDPFGPRPGERLYRTGDRAALEADGNFTFLGRSDHQVKVRGFRVELGEIEHRLRRHPTVKEAVVVARDPRGGDRRLVAYVIPAGGQVVAAEELRRFSAAALPDYMVPNLFCWLESYPATAHGKLDRAALPWPLEGMTPPPPAAGPRLAAEIEALFTELLGGARIDPSRDLFDQGATSFTIVQASTTLLKRHRRPIPVSILLRAPTVDGIAAHLEASGATPESDSKPPKRQRAEVVEVFSPEQRQAFKAERRSLKPAGAEERFWPLAEVRFPEVCHHWRASVRDYLAGPIPQGDFCRFLSLLRQAPGAMLYPSAGETYAVQLYLHLKRGAVEGLPEGLYYYHPCRHGLERLSERAAIDRNLHFQYNRPIFDRAAFQLFLVGQRRGIEPLYGEDAVRYLHLEAGYIGQLLMMGQAACGIGLCAVGSLVFEDLVRPLGLDDGGLFLQGFLGGRSEHTSRAGAEKPPFSEPAPEPGVAIVGLAGRYPGARDPEGLWANLAAGMCSLGPLPRERLESWPAAAPGREVLGGFLADIDRFDSLLFRLSPAEAARLDPQIRLLLETVWECLENAGYSPASLRRVAPRVGVFVGLMWHDFHQVGFETWSRGGEARVTAMGSDAANRISHAFEFRGPSIAVDAACTSSLAALHLAAASLRQGECDAAVVAGVNLVAHPYHLGLLAEHDTLSRGSATAAFDPDSAGWFVGEGCGAVLLRPESAAEAGGDFVQGLIECSWLGAAGGGPRFGAPDAAELAGSIARALAAGGLGPDDIDAVECAAAGAVLADAAEIEALGQVFRDRGERKVPLGTVKPNLGHLESASGMSQLTKALLELRHRRLAPTRVSGRPHPLLDWEQLPLRVVDRLEPWERRGERPSRILINSLGANGSYGHLVLRSPREGGAKATRPAASPEAAWILLSAASRQRLEALARRMRDHLEAEGENGRWPGLADLAFTLQCGRAALRCRLALRASDLPGVVAGLGAFLGGDSWAGLRVAEVSGSASGEVSPASEDEAVEAWLAGAEVSWRHYWRSSPRRLPLPTYPFAAEPHWLEPPVARRPAERAPAEARVVEENRPGELENTLREIYSEVSGIPLAELRADVPLESYGLSSFLIARLNARLERDFPEVSRTLFFEHRDLAGIAAALHCRHAGARPAPRSAGGVEPIAILGLAGRYPEAPDLDRFWRNLEEGRDSIGPLPAERRRPGWPNERMWGGFLDGVDRFDPLFFAISPREAELMDPQERLFLEVTWEALEDAGYPRERLRRRHHSRVGVFVGAMYNEYPFFGVERSLHGPALDAGSAIAGIANRVSYTLDLKGPSMTVDTMCSSSLTALHLAVESLRRGECELALAGGVNLSLHANKFVQLERLRMASSDHRCRSFGAGGDGFVPGEGVGALLLKPLSAARAGGDRILALVRATAVNHDGRTHGYTVPNPVAQGEVIAEALWRAGIDGTAISYLEAHGTGTELGDPVEWNGLMRAFGEARPEAAGRCALGSVKSNIGHLEAAAGIAGITKVVLQMRHRRLVPSLHAERLNPNIDWRRSPFEVQRQAGDWSPRNGRPLAAGVSSFGAGGANAHVVLESHEDPAPRPRADFGEPRWVVLSAFDEERLRVLAGRLAGFLRQRPPELRLDDVAFTLAVGREALRERLALWVDDLDRLATLLEGFASRRAAEPVEGALHGRVPGLGAGREAGERLDLEALGRFWIAGGTVDWSRCFRQPCAIVGLPSYPFARQRCWLPEPATEARPEEPSRPRPEPVRLLVKTWSAEGGGPAPGPRPRSAEGRVLCLFRSAARAVVGELQKLFAPEPLLLLATDSEVSSGLGTLPAAPGEIGGWLDLSDLAPAGQPEAGHGTARRALLQRWLAGRLGTTSRLLHVTRGLQQLAGPPPNLAGATMAGLVRALSGEHRRLEARTVDLEVELDGGIDPAGGARRAALEIFTEWGLAGETTESCWRSGRRYHPRLVAAPEGDGRTGGPALDPDRPILVTGGASGLGALVSRHLVHRGARRLVLLAERALPLAERPVVAELRAAGAEVRLSSGSLVQRAALAALLDEVRADWGPLGGTVHCAGRPSQGPAAFIHKSPDDFTTVWAPKVEGLEALAAALAPDPLAFFVLFSSISASAPALGAGVADYAAANAFLDFFAGCQARLGRPWVRSIAWPSWRRSPGGEAGAAACAALGLGTLSDEQGLAAFDRALAQPASQVLVCPALEGFDPERLLRPREPRPPVPRAPAAPSAKRLDRAAAPAAGAIPAWLRQVFAETLGLRSEQLDPTATFGELGVESVLLAELVQRIEPRLGHPLDPTVLLEHPTLEALAAHLGVAAPAPAVALAAEPVEVRGAARDGDIAVLGMTCRFPGAADVEALWELLAAGRSAVTEVPPWRWDVSRFYRSQPERGRSTSRWGGFVSGLEDFDPEAFGIGEAEATALDPAIRLMLEATVTSLRDAGYREAELAGRAVGVFAGARLSGYRQRVRRRSGAAGLGGDQSFIASRVAKQLDLHGPTLVVDGACASSLVAVHLACQSLRQGDCELAFAAGVEVLLDEEPYLELSAAKALSPSGRCATFDLGADGFVPGEGCGVVLLKPLARALADGDRIRAVIRGSAVNNDGRTMGLTTPNPVAQAEVVRRALAASGLGAGEIGMIEAHGTGTTIGDPIELRALTEVFREGTAGIGFCAIGSIKSNLGHLLSAAGMAGLVKAILALEKRALPATLFCQTPNPRFDFGSSPFFPNLELRPWEPPPGGGPRAAGVSAFGLGGTNAHLVLSELDPALARSVAARAPLPAPLFRRRRLWIERDGERDGENDGPGDRERRERSAPRRASILRLEFPREVRRG